MSAFRRKLRDADIFLIMIAFSVHMFLGKIICPGASGLRPSAGAI